MRPLRVEIEMIKNRISKLQSQIKQKEVQIQECRRQLERLESK